MQCAIFLTLSLVAIFISHATAESAFPPDIERCHYGDTVCVARVATSLTRQHARKGYPAASLPVLEPFHLKKVDVTDGRPGSLNLKLTFRDVDVLGLSGLKFERAVGFTQDPATSKFEMYGDFQKVTIRGKYNADGRILILPIQGDGDAEITFEKPKFSAKFKPALQSRNGKTYLTVEKLKILIEPKKMIIKLDHLFNGDQTLGDHMNQFLNENWRDVWQELEPAVQESIAEILKIVLHNVFKSFPYEDLFLA